MSHAVGTVGSSRRQRSTVRSRKHDSSHRPAPRSASAARTSTATRSSGIEVGIALVVLDLDVHPHAGARVERLAERRHVRRQLPPRRLDDDASVIDTSVMVDDQDTVRRATNVQLNGIGAQLDGQLERLDRVLLREPRRAP